MPSPSPISSRQPAQPRTVDVGDAAQPNPDKIALLEELRPKARKGVATLNRALGGISKERLALLTQDDLDRLRDLAESSHVDERRDGKS